MQLGKREQALFRKVLGYELESIFSWTLKTKERDGYDNLGLSFILQFRRGNEVIGLGFRTIEYEVESGEVFYDYFIAEYALHPTTHDERYLSLHLRALESVEVWGREVSLEDQEEMRRYGLPAPASETHDWFRFHFAGGICVALAFSENAPFVSLLTDIRSEMTERSQHSFYTRKLVIKP